MDAPISRRFDKGALAFSEYLRSPIGRIRLDLTWAQLRAHLPTRRLDVLDVGAGTGDLAMRLAHAGHVVTMVDPSAQLLKISEDNAHALLAPDAVKRIHRVQGTVEELPKLWPNKTFDLVLCHCVVEYIADETVVFRNLDLLTKDEGFLSIVVPNHEGHALRFGARGMLKQAIEALSAPKVDPDLAFGVQRRAYDLATLEGRVRGLEPIGIYAQRIVADTMPESVLQDDYGTVLSLETAMAGVELYRRLGRYLHFIGQKPANADLAKTSVRRPPPPPRRG